MITPAGICVGRDCSEIMSVVPIYVSAPLGTSDRLLPSGVHAIASSMLPHLWGAVSFSV